MAKGCVRGKNHGKIGGEIILASEFLFCLACASYLVVLNNGQLCLRTPPNKPPGPIKVHKKLHWKIYAFSFQFAHLTFRKAKNLTLKIRIQSMDHNLNKELVDLTSDITEGTIGLTRSYSFRSGHAIMLGLAGFN